MELTIAPRFNGPPDSGHGGYVCGLIAALVGDSARVRLHRPPPLGRQLTVRRDGDVVMIFDVDAPIVTGGGAPMLLGELAACVLRPIRAEERCVIAAWTLGREGRKSWSAATLFGEDGTARAVAQATWIAIARR